MPERVTTKSITAEQDDINREDDCADADPESPIEDRGVHHVAPEKREVAERQVEEVAMQVLEDEGERGLAAIAGAVHLGDRARRRIEEVGSIVRLAIVVAGGPEEHGREQDQERG